MESSRIAILGFFALVVGIILLSNAGGFGVETGGGYCSPKPYGNILMFSMFYEIVTGLCLMYGIVMVVTNLSNVKSLTNAFAGIIVAGFIIILFFGSVGTLGGSPMCTACLPSSGYMCTAIVYNHGEVGSGSFPAAGNVMVTIGQTTGTNWVAGNIFFVPQGTSLTGAGVPSSIVTTGLTPTTREGTANVIGYLVSGQTMQIYLGVPGYQTVPVGSTAAGTIWAQYWTNTSTIGGPYYSQIATIAMRAV